MILDAVVPYFQEKPTPPNIDEPPNAEAKKFYEMLLAADMPSWDGCIKLSHLSATTRLRPRSDGVREQDRFLPIANISRIMKKALPTNGKIVKDAKETVQECISEIISFITSEVVKMLYSNMINFLKQTKISLFVIEMLGQVKVTTLLRAIATLGFEE
ncbi:hypothetical protein M9H77_18294 [Catharanthus roseus]|uniref:Uncharacterized protein n=1 Tax=Catharanthus roseus TaxID=4058 RepID=A0ACC0B732_CATRO|nr:hypothetical protein M9H77_18294 [Catharanthus roseus]